ncbi:MAG TPA: hypothetical protein VFV39_06285 [Limnobacter sp.]|nr:hypothetical protein [Limnobacter sp.]
MSVQIASPLPSRLFAANAGDGVHTLNTAIGSNISELDWQRVPVNQRQKQFKFQYEQVAAHWESIVQYLDQSCAQTQMEIQRLQGDRTLKADNPAAHADGLKSLRKQLELRQAAWRRVKAYVTDKTCPKMLDLFYLNQTRQHLQTIANALQNPAINEVDKLPELIELSHGLGVCKEGVAINIIECARQLHQKGQPNKLHALYQQTRATLIDQLLLQAVRSSHASQADHPMVKSFEIHDVQALRNALSESLGLARLQDKHISKQYETTVGAIAKAVIPSLVTRHAVATLMAEKIHARATQILGNQSAGVDALIGLETALKDELGVGLDVVLDPITLEPMPKDQITEALLKGDAGLPAEQHEGEVTQAQLDHAMAAFFDKGTTTSEARSSRRIPTSRGMSGMLMDKLNDTGQASKKSEEESRKKELERRLEMTRNSYVEHLLARKRP